ncbi:LysR family transcriptional regulator [Streptomyces coeruleorubidus]|uniref:LysR family transcriptional regulator n=1 Tax=Streptomyces coeruleorubidus TaxID=116188 RepID=A0ABZ0KRX7_STRC4|nr:LysR family transcriptional regulator [Streptomyces coeruleorubidus]WOT40753.1 LysR family transcriptional regulator [Streptomyces coeruleorubidus]
MGCVIAARGAIVELRHFRYFVAVAEQHSFTRAAARLHVSQPALSQQIRDLERELGVELLVRGPGGSTLTPAGEVFYERIRKVLTEVDAAAHAARRTARDHLTLRVGLAFPMAMEIHVPVLTAFAEAHPHVRLSWREIGFAECEQPLITGEVDVALIRLPIDPELLVWEPLVEEPPGLAVPAGHPLWDADRIGLAHVIDESLPLVHSGVWQRMREYWQLYSHRNDTPPPFVGAPAGTPQEVLLSVRLNQVVCPGPYAVRSLPLPTGVRITQLCDLPPAVTVVARRRDDRRELPHRFSALARLTAQQTVQVDGS